jgi:hypothetical protein
VNCWCEDQRIGNFPWTDGHYSVGNALNIGDILGLDSYMVVGDLPGNQLDEQARCVTLPEKYMKEAISQGKDAWIIESQAEGWGSYEPTVNDVKWLVAQHEAADYRTVFLWGLESWYEKKVRKGDRAMWDAVKDLAKQFRAGPQPSSGAKTYTVQQGDTLAKIARKLGVSLKALEQANPQIKNPNQLVVGQVIAVP